VLVLFAMHARGVGAASEIQVPVKVLRTGAGSAHIFDIIAVTVEATGTIATVRKKILNHFVAAAAAAAGSVNGAAAAAITGEVHDDVHLIMGGRLLPDDFCMLQWDGQTIHCVRRQVRCVCVAYRLVCALSEIGLAGAGFAQLLPNKAFK
jgi:hypothetical protein